jgi:signal transduction histidine kinase
MIDNLEQILSTLRHELGNSVNSIKVTLDVLQQNYDLFDDEKKKHYLKRGSEAIAKQQKLIEAMKSYGKFNANLQQEFAFLNFWNRFISATENRLRDKQIQFLNYHDVRPCFIHANEIALHQAIDNLLDNAIEALENRETPLIEIKALDKGDELAILIKDNGPGIKEQDMPKIFTPLFSTKPGKMGMGLPITLKLLSKMNGNIEIDSTLNQGTEARLWLKQVIYNKQ